MIVGSVVFATDQGLGYLAKEFFDHGIIQKVHVRRHSSRKDHGAEWYPESARVPFATDLLERCDSLLFFEDVFNWDLIPKAREKKIKTALMPMYECTRYPLMYEPEVLISPSLLDKQYYPESVHIPVPVDVPWKLRTRAKTFVHNAGNGGLGGRNGTRELMAAMKHVRSPIRLIIRSQAPLPSTGDRRIEIHVKQHTKEELWSTGDVFIFPEKFNGLSLPMQEAFASGMMVMAGARYPMTEWLPNEPLIPVMRYKKETIAREFDSAIYDPVAIAQTIDRWYDKDISTFSEAGKAFAETHSWQILKDKYLATLSR